MATPTLALTFKDFQIRVAEFLGVNAIAASIAAPPTDAHDLDVVKRCVNDGYREFVTAWDEWRFLTPIMTITFDPTGAGSQCVNSDASRYYMPDGFYGHLIGPWTYPSTGPRRNIQVTDEGIIRQLAQNAQTGDPTMVAHRVLADSLKNTSKTRWEAIFWPTPSAVWTVTTRGRIFPNALSADTDVTVCGYQFDFAVLAFALAVAERERMDAKDVRGQQAEAALQRAMKIDRASAPRRLGYMTDGSDGKSARRHPYTGVDTYNGTPV